MSYLSKLKYLTAVAIGSSTGIGIYLYTRRGQESVVYTSWTTNTIVSPESKWDFNWDHRDPASLVRPLKKNALIEDENKFNELLEKVKPTATKHLILIRHGQYNLNGETDADRYLSETGRKQAACTGERLKVLNIPFDKMIRSTMTRAQETGKIISTHIANIPIENCSLIAEGAPIAPQPPVGHWHPEPYQFYQDGARIEAGFRKYFHRADVKQEKDSYTLIVCHANVIRYFICRALQIPAEAWLRISLNHASITWISIQPSGRVTLRLLGDSGHLPLELVTSR